MDPVSRLSAVALPTGLVEAAPTEGHDPSHMVS